MAMSYSSEHEKQMPVVMFTPHVNVCQTTYHWNVEAEGSHEPSSADQAPDVFYKQQSPK